MKAIWVRLIGLAGMVGVVGVVGVVAIIPLAVAGCGGRDNSQANVPSVRQGVPGEPVKKPTVLFLGTSLTAGYGLSPNQAYPAIIARKADSADQPIDVVNAGISGETSAGLLSRIDWAMKTPADVIFIETGANDGLRAFPVASIHSNILQIIKKVKAKQPNAKIILVAMQIPPNLGFTYASEFRDMYGEIAEEENVTLAPFLLEGVAGSVDYNQADGIHPNARGAEILAENMWKVLREVLN